ncbi:metal-dependent hydrolase, partial [Francisella tularensis subsp. holarctica]|nr:metal-dependent hydrolase [Francisella tularensis subsp. holarctica]
MYEDITLEQVIYIAKKADIDKFVSIAVARTELAEIHKIAADFRDVYVSGGVQPSQGETDHTRGDEQ